MLKRSIEGYTDVPVLGMLPKISPDPVPERHMGLISNREYGEAEAVLGRLAEVVAENCDMDALRQAAAKAEPLPASSKPLWLQHDPAGVRIGVVRDAALWFYYEENIEALRAAGAEVVELSLLDDRPWPELHGLYMGGGFPETQAETLAANETKRKLVKDLAEEGLPIYAECGGFMTLCRSLRMGEKKYPMIGVFDVDVVVCEKPQGLGYVEAEVVHESPFHPAGAVIRGHEFHYSGCPTIGCCLSDFALKLSRGTGITQGRDGLRHKNVFAGYFHLHALGAPWWAERFVAAANAHKQCLASPNEIK
jgi:cobyrinic acid a,c-diamide synthase